MAVISLLSDFGLKDPYVAEMKAVALSICPEAHIVDISHEIEKFNIRMGAFVLASAAPYFPKGTIHVAVVDPGVGTRRRPILVVTKRAYYVGPDNGLLVLSAQRQGISHVYHVTNKRYMLPQVSRTFHGRDIFAPTAAHLAKSHAPSEFGPEINDYLVPEFAEPCLSKNALLGEVLHIDDFGNVITNVSMKELEKIGIEEGGTFRLKLKEDTITLKLCMAYGEVEARQPLAIIGSHGFLEISVNQGNAAKRFKVEIGETVQVSLS
ncbi:MAG: S-adenosyl-l-methionine hydroxide adenosyltransferase family protein [Candidatus Bathyarchaeia archaeon]